MSDEIESRTLDLGREIFSQVLSDRPSIISPAWWDQRLMALGMADEALKVQLFRFVDVLPALNQPQQVNRHLRQYLEQVSDRLPPILRQATRLLPDNGRAGGLIAAAARHSALRLARRFIAGTDLPQTLRAILELRRHHLAFTIDLLGEAVLSEAEAQQYQSQYLHFLAGLSDQAARWPEDPLIDRDWRGPIPRVNVSVKLSSLYSQFDPIDPAGTSHAVRQRLRPILRLARQCHAFVNIDMEQFAYKDLTIRIFRQILEEDEFRDWTDVGIALQAYLRSCGQDLRDLAAWAEQRGAAVWVRLVKGAYWDYETIVAAQQNWPVPVFTHKPQTDANFEALTAFLIERAHLLRPAIASHNVRSIAHALALAEQHHLPPGQIEFQTLYGMADELKTALVRRQQRVRVYTPFGQLLPGMAYLVRRLLENTSNQSFLRAGFLEHLPPEQLLMNPLNLLRRPPASATDHKNGQGQSMSDEHAKPRSAFSNEPLTDFSLEPNRQAMQAALAQVAQALGRSYPAIINNAPLPASAEFDSINPARPAQIVGRCARSTVADAKAAIAAASAAFAGWRDTSPHQRAEHLFRCAEILRRRRFELAAWEVYECGKPWRESDADVAEAIDYCEYYARQMLRLSQPHCRHLPGEENQTHYDPRGVAVIIAPWNFPLAILCGMTTAALVAGNPAVMKPAEQSAVIAAKLMEVFQEAGLPPGVVAYLPGIGEEIGPALVSDPQVALIAFTGSRAVGLDINQQAAHTPPEQDHIKRVIVELGGKNAIIVDEDADLDEAVHGVAASAFGYAGQKCSACSRVILLDAVYDAFLPRLIEVTRSLRLAAPEDPACFIGPVIDAEAHRRILDSIETAQRQAHLVHPTPTQTVGRAYSPTASTPHSALSTQDSALLPTHPCSDGFFIPPHIFTDVPPEAAIAQEEIFGPVLCVLRARDLPHALEIANSTRYALTGGLYSRSPATIAAVRSQFRVGNLYINRKITGALADRQPFGGFKLSGTGTKAGGPDYLLNFLLPRTITENTLRRGFAPSAEPAADLAAAAGE